MRLLLLLMGILILGWVGWDVWRRKRSERLWTKRVEEAQSGHRQGVPHAAISFEHFEQRIYTDRHAPPEATPPKRSADVETITEPVFYHPPKSANSAFGSHAPASFNSNPPAPTAFSVGSGSQSQKFSQESKRNQAPSVDPHDVITISVMSRQADGFFGGQLLEALQAAQMVFGDMDIFHRTTGKNGMGDHLFSLCLATEPGVFDLDELPNQFISGVTLFFIIQKTSAPEHALNTLVRTAKQLAFTLNGELRDQQHRPLTTQTIESYKDRVLSYTREVTRF